MANETDDDDERELLAWCVHQPTARISGRLQALVYMGDLSSSTAQPDDSFAVILDDPEILVGDVFENTERGGESGTVAETIDEDDPRPTDFRFLDGEDDDVAAYDRDGNLTTGENVPNTYVEADEIDADRILVFYNGMSGTRVGRTLDFNGQSYAKFRDDTDYLVKGLYQAHPDWRGAGSEQRSELARSGKAPRVTRAPILRYAVEEIEDPGDGEQSAILHEEFDAPRVIFDVSHYEGARGYEMHLFDEAAFEDEFGNLTTSVDDMERGRYGLEAESELEYGSVRYTVADDILEQAEYGIAWYSDWEQPPDGWSFDTGDEADDFGDLTEEVVTEEDFEGQKADFAAQAANALPDGKNPTNAFPGGLEGLVDKKSEHFYEEPTEEDIAEMKEQIYEQTEWLSVSDLDE